MSPGEELTFGRAADLVIDENRYLHRILGRFSESNGWWWLANVGSSIPITVSDARSPSFTRLAPGATTVISFDSASITFEAGGATYELLVDVLRDAADLDEGDDTDGDDEDHAE